MRAQEQGRRPSGDRRAGLSRREFLYSTTGVAGAAGLGALSAVRQDRARDTGGADLHVRLVAQPGEVSIRPGPPTRVLRYEGSVVGGGRGALTPVEGSYLGPTFRVRRGQRVRIDFRNRLDEPTTVHWHGLDVPPEMDGHPHHAVAPGGSYRYEFTVLNPAGTYWYHPHPMGKTAEQAYAGLAGLFVVSDDAEAELALPAGERDLPLVLQDRRIDDNQFVYPGGDAVEGALGNWLLVNGSTDRTARVAAAPYRLRILNGSNARIYALGWADGSPLTVIGTDGGLLAEAVTRPFVLLAPGERVEVWADFARWRGGEVWLESRAFAGGGMHGGHGPGMHGPRGPPACRPTARRSPSTGSSSPATGRPHDRPAACSTRRCSAPTGRRSGSAPSPSDSPGAAG